MKIGAIVPQGWQGEYDGWDPLDAWRRTVEVARQADELGYESIWLFDHFHAVPRPTDEITFESFTSLSALAARTERVRLGHIVICTGFRNPALTAKMISTMDSISGGRMDLGIGAGWKRDEWIAYGYGFPETKERLAALADHLEVITRMLAGHKHEHATFEGRYARVKDAINVPKSIQKPRVPIMVGGNGPNVTWRLAAKHADELNVDGMTPSDVAEALPVIRSRCEEIGRDAATLPVSVHVWPEVLAKPGSARVDQLAAYGDLGVKRVMTLLRASATSDEALESLAEDARKAGVEMAEGATARAR
ncbi:MAG TPA: TIGR03560 family F420-dependent LLM class oxidoreductase [Candidatus Limnocylindrales bacterium]|jgi:F420-dependent oxidoreductase-like protein|nr:TIGR03560 family F420-dependent LLM class oxidoreductase [Candidatus Limnocylindrales bacterium]